MAKRRKKVTGPQDQDDLVFKALAGKERRQILDLLKNGPMTTGDLGKRLSHLDRTTHSVNLKQDCKNVESQQASLYLTKASPFQDSILLATCSRHSRNPRQE